jgi:uncharacterized membrane protein (Fun14 family)
MSHPIVIRRRANKMSSDGLMSITATIGGGFFAGLVTGWVLKKVIKLVAVVVGLFLGGLIYLQSQTIININWNRMQSVLETGLSAIGTSITNSGEISNIVENVGMPLTSSLSAGFAIGFMKG